MLSLGGGVLLYFHTYVGSDYFLGFKVLNFNIFWGLHKNEYFLGYEDFVDIFWGSSQNWASLMGHLYIYFLRSKYRIGIFFGVSKISNIFWGAGYSRYFFFGGGGGGGGANYRCWARAYV